MSVSVKECQTYIVQIRDDFKASDERSPEVWTVPAPLNPLRIINDLYISKVIAFCKLCQTRAGDKS